MARTAITTARTATTSRSLVLPDSCVGGKCLSFDGTDDKVNAGTSADLDLTGAFTLEGWVRMNRVGIGLLLARDGVGGRSYVIGFGNNGALYYENNVVFSSEIGWPATARVKLDLGCWNYFSIGWDGTSIRGRIIGKTSVSSVCADAAPSSAMTTYIAARGTWGTYGKFNAFNWRVFKGRYTTDAEFALRARGYRGDESNMVRWWRFEDGAGGTVREEVTGANDAITGATWSTDAPFTARTAAGTRTAV